MFSKKVAIVGSSLLAASVALGFLTPAQSNAQSTATSQWCKGVNIVFMTGGDLGSGFADVVYNGAVQATADLGPTTQYVGSAWDPAKMLTDFKTAAATHPDGIAIMGHPGDAAFKPLVDDAIKNGIIVTSQNTGLPTLETAYAGVGFGYSGADQEPQGISEGNEAINVWGLKSGDEVLVWGLLNEAGRGLRTKGIEETLKAAGVTVDDLAIDDATQKDASAGIPTFTGFMSGHPNVKGVITDHGDLTALLPKLLATAGKKAGDVKAAGFDAEPGSIQGIKDGWISFVSDQQEWLQGYLPILNICLTKKFGFSGLHVNTAAGFVTKDNVDMISGLVAAKPEIR